MYGDQSREVDRTPCRGSDARGRVRPRRRFIDGERHLFAWSPDGRSVVYTTETATGMDVHQLTAGVDRVLGSAPSGGAGGCETIAGCAIANSLDFRLAYSQGGTYVSLVVSGFGPSTFRLWSSDGKLLRSNDSQGTTMSVWSNGSLYFRDSGGVEVWRDGVVSTFLPGV